ncbi:hypothetical protein GQ457_14G012030 [Hibiscus cannabinus]
MKPSCIKECIFGYFQKAYNSSCILEVANLNLKFNQLESDAAIEIFTVHNKMYLGNFEQWHQLLHASPTSVQSTKQSMQEKTKLYRTGKVFQVENPTYPTLHPHQQSSVTFRDKLKIPAQRDGLYNLRMMM